MSGIRLAGMCLGLIYGGVELTIGGGTLSNTALAKGHGGHGHKRGGHKGGHAKSHHAAHHHAAHHQSHHHAKHHAHAHASGHGSHTVHGAHAHAVHHFAHHGNHHYHHWYNGHRYWVGNGYYGGTYVNGATVVDGGPVVGAGVAPPLVGAGAVLAYPAVLGNIGAIAGNALTIVRRNGSAMQVSASPATIISLNDQPAALGDLQVSDRVKATYDPTNSAIKLVARRD